MAWAREEGRTGPATRSAGEPGGRRARAWAVGTELGAL